MDVEPFLSGNTVLIIHYLPNELNIIDKMALTMI